MCIRDSRRRMLAKLKAKTPCKDCGRKGHWRGDKECTMQRNRPYERRAHVATRFCENYSTSCRASESTPQFFDIGDCDDADECAYMNVEQDETPTTSLVATEESKEAQPMSLAERALDSQESTVHWSRNARMNRRESSCERSRTAWIRRTMMSGSSSSSIPLSILVDVGHVPENEVRRRRI
mgnify:CR=1 FL=1